MHIGEAIRKRREDMNISARSLSKAIGKSPTYVGKVESGDINLSLREFSKMAIELEMTGMEILYLVRQAVHE